MNFEKFQPASDETVDRLNNSVPTLSEELQQAKKERVKAEEEAEAERTAQMSGAQKVGAAIDKGMASPPGDWLLTAGDTATGGLTRPMGALRELVNEAGTDILEMLVPGKARPEDKDPSLQEAWQRGWAENADVLDEARDDLGTVGRISAEVAGSLTPGGVYTKADDFIKGFARYAPDAKNVALKYGLGTAVQYPTAVWDAYARYDQDLGEALKTGAIDAAVGTALQAGIGDVVLPNATRLWNTLSGGTKAYPAGVLASEGVTTGALDEQGISMAGLYDLANRGNIPEGKGLMDLEIGGATKGELARRYHNGLAKLAFGDDLGRAANTRKGRQQAALYQELRDNVDTIVKKANDDYRAVIDTQLGGWEGEYAAIRDSVGDAKTHGKLMKEMVETAPDAQGNLPIGATKVDADAFTDDVKKSLIDEFGITNLAEGGKEINEVWGRFTNLMRAQYEADTKNWRKLVSDGAKANAQAAQQGQTLYGELPLAQLIRARRTLADTVKPGAMIDGSSVTKLETKATMQVLDALDNKIDELTSGKMGTARGDFAKSMQVQEAHELGEQFYKSRGINASDPKAFGAYYDKSLQEVKESLLNGPNGKERWESFKTGYKKGMHQLVEQRSPSEEFQLYLGKPGGNAATERLSGSENLDIIFGKADADKIRKLHAEGKKELDIKDALTDLLEQKEVNPKRAKDFIGVTNEWAKRGGAAKEDHVMNLLNGIEIMKWGANKATDRKKLEQMAKLLTLEGDELAKFVRESVEAASPGPRQIGVRATGAASSMTKEPDQEILDYLNSVAEENQ